MMTILHVVFGTAALLAAPVAAFLPKRGRYHRLFGIAFTLTMSAVLFSAGFLWQERGHVFLVPLAAISAYLILNGWRAVARGRRRSPDEIADRIDGLAAIAAIAAGLAVAYLGLSADTPLTRSIAPALFGIGAIGIGFGVNELFGFREPRTRLGWLVGHFASMIAAYISAVTAFVVINAHDVPMTARWLVPSAIGGAAIVALTLRELLRRPPAGRIPKENARTVALATPPPEPRVVA